MSRATACIALHMDSLGWASGEGADAPRDPTWFRVLDRFLELADSRGIRYTIFAIGRDLESAAVRQRVRELSDAGHEIGNHSFSHRLDLGAQTKEVIASEISKAQRLITHATGGRRPTGFAAPGWSRSGALMDSLWRAGYTYDASAFPSWLMAPMLAKLLWNFRAHPRLGELLSRRDAPTWLLGNRQPYRSGNGMVELPVPTTRFLRLACWHTLSFVCPPRVFDHVLERSLRAPWFMYVIHPADLFDPSDVPSSLRQSSSSFERLAVPLEQKREKLERVLDKIVEGSRAVVTCQEMARALLDGGPATS